MDKRDGQPQHGNTGYTTRYDPDVHPKAVDDWCNGAWRGVDGIVCPTIESFCLWVGISKQTILNWQKKDYPGWQGKFDKLKLYCESQLVQSSLGGVVKEQTALRVLSVAYGYNDKTIVDNQSSDGSMSPKATIDVSLLPMDALKAIREAKIKQVDNDAPD